MMDDWSLLQEYVHRDSKEALDELVRRHLAMVYGAALRQVGDPHRAEDVTQVVFLVLMQRAKRISKSVVLGGWLFHVTRFTAAKMLRSETRRQGHERKAAAMKTEVVEPQLLAAEQPRSKDLDEAIAAMPCAYRDAIVLRYLQGKSIREIAEAQKSTEIATRQRLFRALAKLRQRLVRKGVVETEPALGALLTAAGAQKSGADLAARIVSGLHSSAATGASSPIVATVLRSLIMTKFKTSLAAAMVALLIGVGGGIVYWAVPQRAATSAAPSTLAGRSASDNTPNLAALNAMNAFLAGDINALIAAFEPMTSEQEASTRKISRTFDAIIVLRSALGQRFGAEPAERFMALIGIEPSQSDLTKIQQVMVTIDGDRAEMTIQGIGKVNCVMINSIWKLRADAYQGTFSQMMAATPMLEQLARDIGAGKYAQIDQVRDDFSRRLKDIQQPDPSPPPYRPAVLAPGATPQETLAAFYWANVSGDEDAAITCLQDPSPGQQRAMRLNTKLYNVGEQVRAAVADRFGQAAARDAVLTLGFDAGINKTLLESAPTTFTGDKAQVDLRRSHGITINLTKTNGVWRIEPIFNESDPPSPWGVLLSDRYLPLALGLAADVRAGKFANLAQLRAAIDSLHQQIKTDHDRIAASSAPK